MKKAKRILALVLAFVMFATMFSTTSFAKQLDPYAYRSDPLQHMNSVKTITLTAEEGCTQILDLLDNLLYDLNLKFEETTLTSVIIIGDIKLTADLTNIDGVFESLYNLVTAVREGDKNCLNKILQVGDISNTIVGIILDILDLGDIKNLSVQALGNQNLSNRICRNVPNKPENTGAADMEVLRRLTQFLSDNRTILKKLATSKLEFGLLDGTIKDLKPDLFNNFTGFLKKTLYGLLWDSSASEAPANWTYDQGVQSIINWLLVDGTGEAAGNGGYSVLGANFEPLIPGMTAAQVKVDELNIYQIVDNVIHGFLNGPVGDLVKGLLLDLLEVDTSVNDGKGDPAVLTAGLYPIIIGAVQGLFEANGAPALVFEGDAASYPVPQIEKVIHWLFSEGALETFITLTPGKIGLTDNFMSLLGDLIGLVPSLFPLLGIDVPDYIKIDPTEFAKTVVDETYGNIYVGLDENVEYYVENPEDVVYDGSGNIDYVATPLLYVKNGSLVNTSDVNGEDYQNPKFIRTKKVISKPEIYAYILKIVLNSIIDGCYFPEWTTSIASVGAYAVGSLAARYIPENNYLDRLDKYHYEVELGQTYTAKGTSANIVAIPYEEIITLESGQEVRFPRAAADIGASIGAYFFNGIFQVNDILGYSFETDTNGETLIMEFLIWGVGQYMTILSGEYRQSDNNFNYIGDNTSVRAVWMRDINEVWAQFVALKAAHPTTSNGIGYVAHTSSSDVRPLVTKLLDKTLFTLIPGSWLPDWIEASGSPSMGLVYYWLGDSLCKFDLQQILGLLEANSDGELNDPLLTVLIRLIDRVLSIVVGGNALLPACTTGTGNRNPLTGDNTTITTLEQFLGDGYNLGTFIEQLLYYLNVYINPLGKTIFPLLATKSIKSATYKEDGTMVNYLNGHQVTIDELTNYYDSFATDKNAVVFAEDILYQNRAKAVTIAENIGEDESYVRTVTVDGATRYAVAIPASFTILPDAMAAAEAASEYTGVSCYVSTRKVNGNTTMVVLKPMDYLNETATQTVNYHYVNGVADDMWYTYDNYHRAAMLTNNGSTRTGQYGEVQYEAGKFRANYLEDYPTNKIYTYLRYEDSLNGAEDYIGEFNDYAQNTLPNAYGEWMMYFINLQLNEKNLYDKNGDGVITAAKDTNPGVPGSPYPYTTASGSATIKNYTDNKSYSFSAIPNTKVVVAALAYANETDENGNKVNNVTLSSIDTESVVRLALNSIAFDITKNANGQYDGSKNWSNLTADELASIQTLCNNIGFTLKYDSANPANSTIERPAFALINTSINGETEFGSIWSYTTDSNGNITGFDKTTAINLKPIQDYRLFAVLGGTPATEAEEIANDIQKAYTSFAKSCTDYDEGLNDYYDNISWRAAESEILIQAVPTLNTLKFILNLTKSAYYPVSQSYGRNKIINEQTGKPYPKWSTSSFDEFQKAYDYGQCLVEAIENGTHGNATQSLVSTCYIAIIKAYKNLKEYGGSADWEQLNRYITQAQEILASDLGVDENNIVKDAENGYTQETLDNLIAMLAVAETFRNNNQQSFDTNHQYEVDDMAIDLYNVINALQFPEGVTPDLRIKPSYKETEGTVDLSPTGKNGAIQEGIIFGLEEGVGLTQEIADVSIYVTGFQINGNDKLAEVNASSYGNGTGSVYKVYDKVKGAAVMYYGVVVGDLNGDTRSDGADKTILTLYNNQALENEITSYMFYAADVDHNGEINFNDIAKVKAHYTYVDQNGLSGPVDGTIDQYVNVPVTE